MDFDARVSSPGEDAGAEQQGLGADASDDGDAAQGDDAASDAWAAFAPASPTTGELYAAWAFAPDDLWIGGADGTYQFDGTAWQTRTGPAANVYMLWGLAPNDLWEVGQSCDVQRWNGTTWTPAPIPNCTSTSYFAVGGTAADDVWLAGTNSVLQHWSAGAFTQTTLTGSTDYWALWPVSANETYFVGTKGTILRRVGTMFTDESIGQNVILSSIWGAGGEYWVVGESGVIFHKPVAGSWTAMTSPTTKFLYWVYGRSAT